MQIGCKRCCHIAHWRQLYANLQPDRYGGRTKVAAVDFPTFFESSAPFVASLRWSLVRNWCGTWQSNLAFGARVACGPWLVFTFRTLKLRIWGAGVRISSGAPFKSSTNESSPFESERLKRFSNGEFFAALVLAVFSGSLSSR